MPAKSWKRIAIVAVVTAAVGCTTPQDTTNTVEGQGTSGSGSVGGSIPALVNVNLENVLNNLSVALSIDRANIPVNAQVPVQVAANVCGVSVSVLSASIASGQASCTATTTSPELVQIVQQQIAAGGDVGGGPQTIGTTNNMM
ncbi:MAG TPA: hypothetical protein VNH53_02370 [Sphingomicrobium sp.]|jgi:hypothetical protein|nr:hypothetical protein [Sphingomicrobium sp.]